MWESGVILGGRKNGYGCIPQRSRLVANREDRILRASLAFGLLREVDDETTDDIYDRTRELQQENFIPEKVTLFNHDLYSAIVQKRRIRKHLIANSAGRFTLSSVSRRIERDIPGHGRTGVNANIARVDTIGSDRKLIVARIKDKNGVLVNQGKVTKRVLGDYGIKLSRAEAPYIALGISDAGLSAAERSRTADAIFESIRGVEVSLGPVMIEHNGTRVPLDCAKELG